MPMQLSTALVSGEATAGAAASMRLVGAFASGEGMPIDVSVAGAGGVQLGGAALVEVPAIYTEVGSGGVQISGAAGVSANIPTTYTEVGSGGVQLGGAAAVSARYAVVGTGGVQLGGSADSGFATAGLFIEVGSGGVLLGGAAVVEVVIVAIYTEVGSGGIQAGGAATDSFYRPPLSGSFSPINAISAEFPRPSASIDALLGSIADFSAPLYPLTVALTGGSQGLFAELPVLGSTFDALAGATATLAAEFPRAEFASEASTRYQGSISATAPGFAAALTALTGSTATLAAVLPRPAAVFFVQLGSHAVLSAVLPGLRFSGVGSQQANAVLSAALPRFNSIFYGGAPGQWVASPVLNTRTAAVTQYDLELNSFAEINGVLYGAGPDGVLELGVGVRDDSAEIDAYFTTGWEDYGTPQLKRVSNIYAALVSDGPVTFGLEADEGVRIDYTMAATDGVLQQRRVTTAKGARGRYWRLHVHNIDGSAFRADEIITPVTNTTRRV